VDFEADLHIRRNDGEDEGILSLIFFIFGNIFEKMWLVFRFRICSLANKFVRGLRLLGLGNQ
jgi:hypothetical protein